jgi:hypothetical protein
MVPYGTDTQAVSMSVLQSVCNDVSFALWPLDEATSSADFFNREQGNLTEREGSVQFTSSLR